MQHARSAHAHRVQPSSTMCAQVGALISGLPGWTGAGILAATRIPSALHLWRQGLCCCSAAASCAVPTHRKRVHPAPVPLMCWCCRLTSWTAHKRCRRWPRQLMRLSGVQASTSLCTTQVRGHASGVLQEQVVAELPWCCLTGHAPRPEVAVELYHPVLPQTARNMLGGSGQAEHALAPVAGLSCGRRLPARAGIRDDRRGCRGAVGHQRPSTHPPDTGRAATHAQAVGAAAALAVPLAACASVAVAAPGRLWVQPLCLPACLLGCCGSPTLQCRYIHADPTQSVASTASLTSPCPVQRRLICAVPVLSCAVLSFTVLSCPGAKAAWWLCPAWQPRCPRQARPCTQQPRWQCGATLRRLPQSWQTSECPVLDCASPYVAVRT